MAHHGTEQRQKTSTAGCSFDARDSGNWSHRFSYAVFHLTEVLKLHSTSDCFPESMSFARRTEQSERRRVSDQETKKFSVSPFSLKL